MVPLNLNLKLTCGKLVCISHSSSSIFCKLVNNPAHAQKFVVSISPRYVWLEYQKLACSSILFIKTHGSVSAAKKPRNT